MGFPEVPTIKLDKTLADFYAEENVGNDERIALVAIYPLGFRLPNQRYVYHDESFKETNETTSVLHGNWHGETTSTELKFMEGSTHGDVENAMEEEVQKSVRGDMTTTKHSKKGDMEKGAPPEIVASLADGDTESTMHGDIATRARKGDIEITTHGRIEVHMADGDMNGTMYGDMEITTHGHVENTMMGKISQVIGTQKFAMCAGSMDVYMFNMGKDSPDNKASQHFRNSIESTLKTLDESQQPRPIYLEPSSTYPVPPNVKLAPRLPLDGMQKVAHILDPDIHYELLSKRGLAISSITTPAAKLIDLGTDAEIQEKRDYSYQKMYPGFYYPDIPLSNHTIQKWKDETLEAVTFKPLPFVVKLQQTLYGDGTFIITTEEKRQSVINRLPSIWHHNLSRTNASNLHLRPATIIVSEFITSKPGEQISWAITFFVRRDGTATFISCCPQNFTEEDTWDGASITYSEQGAYEQRFAKTVSEVASYLNCKGYYGCVGIDVLEDVNGKQWVVDLNVRPPGSLILGLLKGYLYHERGFNESTLYSQIETKWTKEKFLEQFRDQLATGRIVITAWYDDLENQVSWASVIVSYKDKAEVEEIGKLLRESSGD
jgi:hypothetical protein